MAEFPSLHLERARGMPGLHMLRLTLDLQCRLPANTPESVPGTLMGALWLGASPTLRLLGHGHALGPIYYRPGVNPSSEELHFDVHPEQLAAIEDLRDGRALDGRLELRISFPTQGDGQQADWPSRTEFSISAPEWAEVLAQFQLADSVLLLVPAPSLEAGDEVRRSFVRWKEARAALDGGRYRDAVKSVREAIELLDLRPSTLKPPDRGVSERWHAIGESLRGLANAAHHDDGPLKDADWTRADAVAAVATCGALLRLRIEERI